MTVERAPSWELIDVTKRFPGVVANDRVTIRLYPGEIHGLLGENGSGKSTLIKTLCGVHQPDGGEILRRGEPVMLSGPIAARAAGISTVFQEFSVVPTLTVAENIFLGRLPRRHGRVDWQAMHDGAAEVLERISVQIDPEAIVGELSVAEQQLVEIAKAIAADASMIILDEPTTALGIDEIAQLHGLLRRLRDQGRTILYISHRLDEVVELVDVVTILKDGRVVSASGDTPVELNSIVGAMVGDVEEHYPKETNATDAVLLEARNLQTANRVNGASFVLHRGEVFGLGGVLGSGRTEIARALFGIDALTAGEIRVDGAPLAPKHPSDAIAAGLALVPENRKFDGLFFNFSGVPNISIAKLSRLIVRGFLNLGREVDEGRRLIERLKLTPESESRLVGLLSGGNQQKVVIARWLFAGAKVFILDEPTQGIDIGAKVAVYRLINELTRAGNGVVLISSDHDELLAMSDRIGVVSHGRISLVETPQALTKTDLVRASAREEEIAA